MANHVFPMTQPSGAVAALNGRFILDESLGD